MKRISASFFIAVKAITTEGTEGTEGSVSSVPSVVNLTFSLLQLRLNVAPIKPILDQQHRQMKNQIGDLRSHALAAPGEDHLDRFFADFLRDLVAPFFKKQRGVRAG